MIFWNFIPSWQSNIKSNKIPLCGKQFEIIKELEIWLWMRE
jgi:hypothetical protein